MSSRRAFLAVVPALVSAAVLPAVVVAPARADDAAPRSLSYEEAESLNRKRRAEITLVLFGGSFVGDWSIETSGTANWLGTWVATPHQESVPEPASLLLLGTGAAGIAANARRRRNRDRLG